MLLKTTNPVKSLNILSLIVEPLNEKMFIFIHYINIILILYFAFFNMKKNLLENVNERQNSEKREANGHP